jgi:hypothetical protein
MAVLFTQFAFGIGYNIFLLSPMQFFSSWACLPFLPRRIVSLNCTPSTYAFCCTKCHDRSALPHHPIFRIPPTLFLVTNRPFLPLVPPVTDGLTNFTYMSTKMCWTKKKSYHFDTVFLLRTRCLLVADHYPQVPPLPTSLRSSIVCIFVNNKSFLFPPLYLFHSKNY